MMKTFGLIAMGLVIGYWMPMFFSLGALVLNHCGGM